MLFGLPPGTVTLLVVIVALPVAAYGLYRVDRTRADGYVSVFGFRAPDNVE